MGGGSKNKNEKTFKYYAVTVGRKPGIYDNWHNTKETPINSVVPPIKDFITKPKHCNL